MESAASKSIGTGPMHSRWFNLAVVLLWLTSMGWLFAEKVIPTLVIGQPPSSRRILAAQRSDVLVGWDLQWNDRPMGWAVTGVNPLSDGMTEVKSLVHFDSVHLGEMVPPFLRRMFDLGGNLGQVEVKFEARSTLVFDSFGHVSRFESAVGFPPSADWIKIRGAVDGSEVRIELRIGDSRPEPMTLQVGNAMLSDSLSPQGRLPDLREGQEWTLETYSPLARPDKPTEILHARVESLGRLLWNGQEVETWVVVFRGDPGSRLDGDPDVRAKLWVDREGRVLRQQARALESQMTFVRLSDRQTAELVARHRIDLSKAPPPSQGPYAIPGL